MDQTRIGRFRYDLTTDAWEWSAGLYLVYGFEPGEVVPSTGLLRAHVHPDDEARALEVGLRVLRHGEPFSAYFRIIDAGTRVRRLLAVGQPSSNGTGEVCGVEGHVVDLTEANEALSRVEVTAAVNDFKTHRAVIEQAKGVLVQLCSIDADTAFVALVQLSKQSNVRVRVLSERLVDAASHERTPARHPQERVLDLMTDLLR
ncbi:PAS and ANTAR domain-containing protein [Nocardioides guangzhouensis]|uniref:PAS and ANTAR domain-containing protein n=1 Tax=Nocardioides guangzhouensis TaxID=2497878 RepID=UPI00143851FD|nr:PAS and ANTAR domain-containing protein [Nocardioides guangzhouensis]